MGDVSYFKIASTPGVGEVNSKMNQRSKILISSTAWQGTLACVQSLGRRGCDVYVVDHDPLMSAVAHSRFCKGVVASPEEADEQAYTDFIGRHLQEIRYDLFIPISDRCVRYCSQNRSDWGQYVRLLLPPTDAVALASSKTKTCEFAIQEGITIPQTYFPADLDEVKRLCTEDIYPCVVKIPVSTASKGVFIANDQQELMRLYSSNDFDRQWPIIQRYVKGPFYGATAVAEQGEIVSSFMFSNLEQHLTGGTHPWALGASDPALLDITAKIIRKLNWTGAIDLDFIKGGDSRYYLLEINPRFSGTINFAYRLGIDLPWDYWCVSQGRPVEDRVPVAHMEQKHFATLLPTALLWSYKNKKIISDFLPGLFNFKDKNNIYLDDPMLLFFQWREAYWHWQDARKLMERS